MYRGPHVDREPTVAHVWPRPIHFLTEVKAVKRVLTYQLYFVIPQWDRARIVNQQYTYVSHTPMGDTVKECFLFLFHRVKQLVEAIRVEWMLTNEFDASLIKFDFYFFLLP